MAKYSSHHILLNNNRAQLKISFQLEVDSSHICEVYFCKGPLCKGPSFFKKKVLLISHNALSAYIHITYWSYFYFKENRNEDRERKHSSDCSITKRYKGPSCVRAAYGSGGGDLG